MDKPNAWQHMTLGALQNRMIYGGTVPAAVKADRRIKNRVARKSRRINRGNR
ncbi:MAG TPA: hypothetical protein VGH54_10300 [Mycobacterium sp.]|jgi:hypothetical protein|uniref:hypothetical protein n=1 Tax=Mycobacterium sp. TaxID=1785 RepID=UPI002F3F3E55